MDFTPLEQAFKYVYEHQWTPQQALTAYREGGELPDILDSHLQDKDAFLKIMQSLDAGETLGDALFFHLDEKEDIFLNRHSRYMPAFRHCHQFFELQYVMQGTLHQRVANCDMTLQAGDVCFLAPGTEHAVFVFDEETVIINILIRTETFRSVFMNQLNENDIISDFFSRVLLCSSHYPYIYCNTASEQELSAVIREMLQIRDSYMRLKNRMLIAKLEEFFIYLLEKNAYDFVTGSNIGEVEKKILPILHYIQDHFQTVTLPELAREFGYSETYLSHVITAYSGRGFSQIVKEARLKHAANLLTTTSIPVDQVGADSGYGDRTNFYKSFKKQFGITPAAYRRQSIGQTADL